MAVKNPDALVMGRPIMSGHCQFPETDHPDRSHERCAENGGGVKSKPTGLFHPCPCSCHLGEEFECQCGGIIRLAPALGRDEDDDEQYVHVDTDGNLTFEGCRS
jgi:hypothetical protein